MSFGPEVQLQMLFVGCVHCFWTTFTLFSTTFNELFSFQSKSLHLSVGWWTVRYESFSSGSCSLCSRVYFHTTHVVEYLIMHPCVWVLGWSHFTGWKVFLPLLFCLLENDVKNVNIPASMSLSGSTAEGQGVQIHLPSKFHGNLFSSFCLMLPTNQPTNQPTNKPTRAIETLTLNHKVSTYI